MSSIGRASTLLAAGTLVSRLTGFARFIVLAIAIGTFGKAGDAFATANQLPNSLFTIIQTGLLTAVIIPQIVQAAARKDGGNSYISKLFTLGAVIFLAITAIAMVLAPFLVFIYAKDYTPEQHALATAFAYWCLPQIFFYGLYALIGETLNARRVFGPYTWTPIANNVVSIIGFGVFIALFGTNRTVVGDWTPAMISLIGGTATLGIVMQAGLLLFAWRRTGLRLRPDFRWRGVGLGQVGKLAGWTFLMVMAGQLTGLLQATLVSGASGPYASVFLMQAAWLVFMLPYSIFAVSIGTPYFTQIAEHASAGRDGEVRADVGACIRAVSLFIVVSTAGLVAAAIPATRIFTNSAEQATLAAPVLIAYLVGLLPLAVLFIVQRTFYAYDDTRTPFWFTVVQCTIIVVMTLVLVPVVPLAQLAAMIALVQSFAGIVQTLIALLLLRRRLGGLDLRRTAVSLLRFAVAAVPAGLAGWGVFLLLGGTEGWMVADRLLGALGAAVICGVTFVVYLGVLAVLRAPEMSVAKGLLRRFLPGRG